jgi:hypothetical protein
MIEEEELKYEILPEDCANSDLSFKIIVIGDSGKDALKKVSESLV